MKKIIIPILLLIFVAGCGSSAFSGVYDRDGLYFEYPDSFDITADFDPSDTENEIIVKKQTISELVNDCYPEGFYDRKQEFTDILKKFKKVGLSADIKSVDNLACGWAGGNIYQEEFNIGNLNGVYFNKALGQEIGGMDIFNSQLLVINQYDEVYTITFNYSAYESVNDYLKSIKGKLYEHLDYYADDETWYEVFDYFEMKEPLKHEELKGYQKGEELFKEILKTVELR